MTLSNINRKWKTITWLCQSCTPTLLPENAWKIKGLLGLAHTQKEKLILHNFMQWNMQGLRAIFSQKPTTTRSSTHNAITHLIKWKYHLAADYVRLGLCCGWSSKITKTGKERCFNENIQIRKAFRQPDRKMKLRKKRIPHLPTCQNFSFKAKANKAYCLPLVPSFHHLLFTLLPKIYLGLAKNSLSCSSLKNARFMHKYPHPLLLTSSQPCPSSIQFSLYWQAG